MEATGAVSNTTCGSAGNGGETKLTLGGIGPRLALLCLPYIILCLIVMHKNPEFGDLKFLNRAFIKALGFIWLGLGLVFWGWSGIHFLMHIREGKLIKSGPYALCRNPIYSSLIVFVIPSLGVIFHSGLLFSIALVLYSGFKFSIHGEDIPLGRLFGQEYEEYRESVNEIIPLPRRLFSRKASDCE